MERQTIRIVSYNTHLFGGTVAGLVQSYEDTDRAQAIADHIIAIGCDIACFCEVWSDSMKEMIRNRLRTKGGLDQFYFYDLPFYEMGDGLLICSKFPLLHHSHIGYQPHLSGWDALAHKGAIAVCVAHSENEHFRLILTHTQAEDSREAKANRGKNLDAIQKFATEYFPDLPVVICGDFNVGHAEYESMKARFADFTDCGHEANEPTYERQNKLVQKWGKPDAQPERFDYFLTKGITPIPDSFDSPKWKFPSKKLADEQVDCSDHYPITMEFTVDTPPRCVAEEEYPNRIKAFAYAEQKKIHEEIKERSLSSSLMMNRMSQQRVQDLQMRFWIGQERENEEEEDARPRTILDHWERDRHSRFVQILERRGPTDQVEEESGE